ncbi:MAG: phage tail family protein [Atopobiaceae bacterium]|nr:phage tail family protein [Atopobiaceae bacterium]
MFDNHNLEDLLVLGSPSFNIINSVPNTIDVSSRDGELVQEVRYGSSSITFQAAVVGTNTEKRNKLSQLAMWLDVDEPKRLVLPDTPDRYYLAIPDGSLEIRRLIDADFFVVTFRITEPAAYGAEQSITIPSGGSTSFSVDGTYKTALKVTCAQATGNANNLWGVRLDNGIVMRCELPISSCAITLDSESRTCRANNTNTQITLASDWFFASPGTHSIKNDVGSGECVVSWTERWL